MTAGEMIAHLKQFARVQMVEGMARFGSHPAHALGISIPCLRRVAKKHGKDQELALALWNSGIHEARILASMLAEPQLLSPQFMDAWVHDFDSWDICDQVCGNLFDQTPFAYQNAVQWCHEEPEFVRRAGFVMMAELAVHDKRATNASFLPFFAAIKQYAGDERNFVKKAVNWSLRQIGKRNAALCEEALACANDIRQMQSKAAQWIARDALKELQGKRWYNAVSRE